MDTYKSGAFGAWLRAQPLAIARQHLWECLATGEHSEANPNMAWELWEHVHGDKAISPEPQAIIEALDAMLAAIGHNLEP